MTGLGIFNVTREPGEDAADEGWTRMISADQEKLCAYCGFRFADGEVVQYVARVNGRIDYYHQDHEACTRRLGK